MALPTSIVQASCRNNDIETEIVPEVAGRPASHVYFVQGVSKERRQSFEIEIELRGICQIGESKEAAGCDWGKLIYDVTDQLIFDFFPSAKNILRYRVTKQWILGYTPSLQLCYNSLMMKLMIYRNHNLLVLLTLMNNVKLKK